MRRALIFALSIFAIAIILYKLDFHLSTKAQTNSYNWPQFQHDQNRTGYNPDPSAKFDYSLTWQKRFVNDAITRTNQPIAIGSSIFIGTEKGKMYSLNLTNGNILWQKQLDGGITHSAAASNNSVFVGTLKGNIYALDINTGNEQWKVTKPGSFSSAALYDDPTNTLYMVNRNGVVYAINGSNGNEVWNKNIGTTTSATPTMGDGKLYIGGTNMKMYALEVATGNIVWESPQINGLSFDNYAPVYIQKKLIFTVLPERYTFTFNNKPLMDQANMDVASNTLSQSQDATVSWLSENPDSKTYYVLNTDTGTEQYTAGVLHTVVNGGAQPPPVIAKGEVVTLFHVAGTSWNGCDYYCSLFQRIPYGAIGVLDLITGKIIERLTQTGMSVNIGGELTVDETNNISGAGDIIMGARCQTFPACMPFRSSKTSCLVHANVYYEFSDDMCAPNAAPIYINGYIIYNSYNTIIGLKGV